MKTFIAALACLLFIQFAKAQYPSVEWVRASGFEYYSKHYINEIQRNTYKGFIGAGIGFFNARHPLSDIYSKYSKKNDTTSFLVMFDSAGLFYRFVDFYSSYANTMKGAKSLVLDDSGNVVLAIDILSNGINWNFGITKVSKTSLESDYINTYKFIQVFGGSGADIPMKLINTGSTGYLLAGCTNSTNLPTANHGANDVWLVKTNTAGQLQWSKTYGGTLEDTAYSVIALPDGFVVAGTTTSNDGDVVGNHGSQDGWVFKIDSIGNLLWQKTFGGTGRDVLNNVIWDTATNSLIFSGYSASASIGNTNGHGNHDFWLMKTNMNGELLWSKLLGGTEEDASFGISKVPTESRYLASGFTKSSDGDVTGLGKGYDAWILMLNEFGDLIWQKKIIGSNDDNFVNVFAESGSQYLGIGNTQTLKPDPYCPSCSPNIHGGFLTAKLAVGNALSCQTYFDANNNGTKDPSEEAFDAVNIVAQKQGGGSKTGFAYDGWYQMALDTGTYTVKAQLYSPYFRVVPDSVTISHSSYYFSDTVHFAIQAIPGIKDASVTLLPITPVRPGFNVQHKLIVANVGTEALVNVPVRLVKDARLSYLSANPAPDSVRADTLYWHISLLAPQDTVNILINTKAATPPTLSNGNSLQSIAQILQSADADSSNNQFVLNQLATGSYDPNDKRNALGKQATKEELAANGWINYLIRFQNTGTDTAFTVVLRDTLPANLEMASLQMVDASHGYQMEANGRALVWRFENILLPDSNHSKTASNGYVAYRVKASAQPAVGDTIKNKAAIYFDFNLPVITNTDLLTIVNAPGTICPSGTAVFNAGNAGAISYQWQLDYGEGFANIANSASYSGTSTTQLSISNIPSSWYGYQYRCRMVLPGGQEAFSAAVSLKFVNQWKGTANNSWHNTSNWSCGQIPDAFTDVIIPAGVPFSPIINQPGAECRSASLLTGASLQLANGSTLEVKK